MCSHTDRIRVKVADHLIRTAHRQIVNGEESHVNSVRRERNLDITLLTPGYDGIPAWIMENRRKPRAFFPRQVRVSWRAETGPWVTQGVEVNGPQRLIGGNVGKLVCRATFLWPPSADDADYSWMKPPTPDWLRMLIQQHDPCEGWPQQITTKGDEGCPDSTQTTTW